MSIAGRTQPVRRFVRAKRRWLAGLGFVLLAGVMIAIWLVGRNWPFRYRIIHPELESVFGSQVQIAHYARTYFPNPGFVATGLTLSRNSDAKSPIGTVQQLAVQGHWLDLFTLNRRLQLVQMKGVHITLPAPGSKPAQQQFPSGSSGDFMGPSIPVQTLEITNSVLEIQRIHGGSFKFPVTELHIENLERGRAITFAVDMRNPIPKGHIRASGKFGPLNAKNLGATPLSGEYRFTEVRLTGIGELHGEVSAYGRFHGTMGAIETEASVNTPDFAVSDGRPIPFNGRLQCTVNGLNGDVHYQSMEARSGQTLITASGSTTGGEKTTHLWIQIARGRAEDILKPFLHKEPPIAGPVALHAAATLGPQSQGSFLQRLVVEGGFDAPADKLTNASEQLTLSAFSSRARDLDLPDPKAHPDKAYETPQVFSSLQGPATIRKGVVTSRHLVFRVPGAEARLHGTYSFGSEAVHLTGHLRMQSDVSHTVSGFKAVLLKPLAPFFHHKHAGADIPIVITGKPGDYKISQNIFH
ncbi:MAG: AsmA-like C-terminal region-containing protein [Acidobacteriota bacterium]